MSPTVSRQRPQTIIPGAQFVSEWGIRFAGRVATCNEAAEATITGIYGVMPATQQTDIWLTRDQIAHGEANPDGSSNWYSDSRQLGRLGIDNDALGPSWVHSHDWAAEVRYALARGIPTLFGVPRAYNLKDSVTGDTPDLNVTGHALTFVGEDDWGFIVMDPNRPVDFNNFMHYRADNLNSAGIDSLVVPKESPPVVGGGFPGGDIFAGIEQWLASVAKDVLIRVSLVLAALILLAVGLLVFFGGGSGQQVATGAIKAAVTK